MTNLVILANDAGRVSAERLGYPVYLAPQEVPADSLVLRWGSSEWNGEADFENVLNPRKAIKKNTDKIRATQALKMAVNAPELFLERIAEGVEAIIRPISHSRGEGMFHCRGPARVPEGHYGVEAIGDCREFRAWFSPDNVLLAERVPTNGQRTNDRYPNRAGWGYSFTEISDEFHAEVRRAAAVIGLDFGAADVLKTRDHRRYFLELNSCPSLDQSRVLQFFINSLNRFSRREINNDSNDTINNNDYYMGQRVAARRMP